MGGTGHRFIGVILWIAAAACFWVGFRIDPTVSTGGSALGLDRVANLQMLFYQLIWFVIAGTAFVSGALFLATAAIVDVVTKDRPVDDGGQI